MSDVEAVAKRFWPNVKRRGADDCWPWVGRSAVKGGRGIMSVNGKTTTAPRVSWFVHYGRWPEPEQLACHKCDNPACVNPNHLWLGSNQDNILDASSKGRLSGQSKTHCKRGHPLSGDNMRLNSQGHRSCRACQTEHRRKHISDPDARKRKNAADRAWRARMKARAALTTQEKPMTDTKTEWTRDMKTEWERRADIEAEERRMKQIAEADGRKP